MTGEVLSYLSFQSILNLSPVLTCTGGGEIKLDSLWIQFSTYIFLSWDRFWVTCNVAMVNKNFICMSLWKCSRHIFMYKRSKTLSWLQYNYFAYRKISHWGDKCKYVLFVSKNCLPLQLSILAQNPVSWILKTPRQESFFAATSETLITFLFILKFFAVFLFVCKQGWKKHLR